MAACSGSRGAKAAAAVCPGPEEACADVRSEQVHVHTVRFQMQCNVALRQPWLVAHAQITGDECQLLCMHTSAYGSP
jgi:hypothetical protein